MFLAAILATLLSADPMTELPEYYDTYGPQKSRELVGACVKAGAGTFEAQSLRRFCLCHVFLLESVAPLPDLEKLTPAEVSELFTEITKGCHQLGYVPAPVQKPKKDPAPAVPNRGEGNRALEL
jgi:hypothetical protein